MRNRHRHAIEQRRVDGVKAPLHFKTRRHAIAFAISRTDELDILMVESFERSIT